MDLEVGPDDGALVDPHPAGADTVVDRRGPVEDLAAQVLPGQVRPGVDLVLDGATERSPTHDLADHLRSLGQDLEVARVGEVAEVDQRRGHRVARGQAQGAATPRVDQRREHGERRAGVDVVADRLVLVGRDVGPRQQMQLQVRDVGRLRRTHEADRLEDRVRQERPARPEHLLGHALGEEPGVAAHRGGGHVVGHRVEHVVVQVVADREVGDGGDAVLREVLGMTDAREHQQLCGPDEPGRADDLPARPDDPRGTVLVDHRDAHGPAALDDDLVDQHLGLQLERRYVEVVDVAARGAVPQPVRSVLLHPADPLLRVGVVVVEDLHAQRVGGGLDELEGAFLGRPVPRDADGATGAAVVVGAVLEVLHRACTPR